ncbi:tRNA pseudouridine(55) synthase TruB [Candidatus Saccharibacteria bacterium]|nr:tRNA pseudouridine(55) synthase TruB [Candidatus Saccharibacteria bacterium]
MFDQIILIDKPAEMTSFGVVARVRRILSEKAGKKIKVGHTGTLDPFATGLLILMTGKNTKKCQEFLKKDKRYEATLKLGWTSTTGDPEGELESRSVETPPTVSAIKQALKTFQGEITQTVPRFSAVKIDGRRAYDLARKGQEVEMPTRKVIIYEINLLDYSFPYLKIDCKVGSGTYIRSLAEDIGQNLGTGAYLTALRRTEIDRYKVEDALPLDLWMQENSCQE